MYNNYNTNNYGNTNYNNSSNNKNKSRIYTFCLFGFYTLCIVFIIIGVSFWWNNKETFFLTNSEISMITNDSYQISLYGKTESKKTSSYKYTSSNPDIVTVNENGVIHSVSEGEASITVKSKYSSKKNVMKVNVEGNSIYSVEFGNDKINIDLDEKINLKPIINGDPNFKANLVWKTDDNKIVTVNSDGVIRGNNPGTTYITVTVKNTKISSKLKVNVSSTKATSNNNTSNNKNISEDSTDEEIENVNTYIGVVDVEAKVDNNKIYPGNFIRVNYNVSPSNASNKSVTWSSSDESVAKVDQKGIVRGISPGTVDISVKTQDGNKTSFVTITVLDKATTNASIELNKKETTIKILESEKLYATVEPSNTKIIWSSDNTKVAGVDQSGKVVGKIKGTANISAKTEDGTVVATCKVNVVNNNTEVENLVLNKSKVSLVKGKTEQISVSVNPGTAIRQSVTFTSADNNIATVDQSGRITAINNGNTTVTATTSNGKSVSCAVVVGEIKISSITVKKSSIQLGLGNTYTIGTSITPSDASNKSLSYVSSDNGIVTVDNNGNMHGVGLGTAKVSIKANDGSGKVAKIKVVVVPNVSLINAKAASYKNYYKNIENYITTKRSKHMQNFAIQNIGTNDEVVYLSGVTAGNTSDPMTAITKANLSRTLIVRIPKNTIYTDSRNRSIMHLNNTGHGQSFDIEDSGVVWTNAKAVEPYFSSNRWWGQHKGAMRINFTANTRESSFVPLATIYPKDPSTGKPYIGLDVSVDEENDLLATRSGKKVIVYKLSEARKSKLVKLYEFNVNNTSTYRQGEDISGGYYYLLLGSAGNAMRLEVYDMLGALKYSKNFYATSKENSVKNDVEPEGLKIYNKKVFVGLTYTKNGQDVFFNIGYLE